MLKSKSDGTKLTLPIQSVKGIGLLVSQQRGQAKTNNSGISESPDGRPMSPAFSQQGSTGGTSSGTSSCRTESPPLSRGNSRVYRRDSLNSDMCGAVAAMIESSHAGCLPGDLLPLKISVDHTKPVKAMQGIIVTLYRQGRIDTSPTIPLGPSIKGQKQGYEYYPKSLTGLGGLSLSSAGSSRLFRQDLNQTFTPLIIDPRSLTAMVKTSIQVPENAFPTISSTPGAMISFRYYLEVVIDLRGKPITQDRFLPRLGMVNVGPSYGQGEPMINGVDGLMSSTTSGFCSLDTSQMRREKGVVSSVFEVTVGTRDSNRKRSKQKETVQSADNIQMDQPLDSEGDGSGVLGQQSYPQNPIFEADQQEPFFPPGEHGVYHSVPDTNSSHPVMISPPMIEDDGDEKTRLKRAEERLLPSAPPGDDGPSYSTSSYPQPSAPVAFDDPDCLHSNVPSYGEASGSISATITQNGNFWRSPEYQAGDPLPSAIGTDDDKQELERQRLQMAVSSPDNTPEDVTPWSDFQQNDCIEPTAPRLDDDHPYQYYGSREPITSPTLADHVVSNESLPVYRK